MKLANTLKSFAAALESGIPARDVEVSLPLENLQLLGRRLDEEGHDEAQSEDGATVKLRAG
jgi:hypothetical protein